MGRPPKYQVLFPTITSHTLYSPLLSELCFQIRDIQQGKCTGMIKKERNFSFQFEACSNATLYFIDFPHGASPLEKLLIVSAAQVIDQNFFNRRLGVGSCKGLLCCLFPILCCL